MTQIHEHAHSMPIEGDSDVAAMSSGPTVLEQHPHHHAKQQLQYSLSQLLVLKHQLECRLVPGNLHPGELIQRQAETHTLFGRFDHIMQTVNQAMKLLD